MLWLPIAFFLWIIGGLAALIMVTTLIGSACRYAPLQDTQRAQQNGSENHASAAQKNQYSASGSKQPANDFFFPLDLKRAAEKEADSKERQSQWQQESWWGKFWCEVKASDAAVAFFTYTLFIAGWFAIRNAARLARELERAYVSGGGPWVELGPLFPGIRGFQMTADNYGKSPATVIGYALEVCERNALPRKPNYRRIPLRNTIKPQEKGLIITTRLFGTPFQNPVAYGRIWYRDVWRKKHYFSFILTIDTTDHSSVSNVHRAYTDWT